MFRLIITHAIFIMILTMTGILSLVSIFGMVTIRDLDTMVTSVINHTFTPFVITRHIIIRDTTIRDGMTTATTDITARVITMAIARNHLGEEISHAVLKMFMPAVNRFKDPAPRQPVHIKPGLNQRMVLREWQ